MATRAEWARRVERWRKSGLSGEDFAAREGLKPKQLGWWRWKLRSSPPAAPSPPPVSPPPELRFLPVRVVDAAARAAGSGVALEVALPNGRVVRVPPGFDPTMLERVLSIASEGEPC
jgi:transposase